MKGRRSLLGAGFAALSQWRLIALLALVTALLGVTAAAPLWPALDEAFAGTLAGDHVLKNHPTFAPTDVFDFLRENWAAVKGTARTTLWAALLAVVAQMVFAGGIVAALGKAGPFSWTEFLTGCWKNLWHNVKCFAIFAGLCLVVPGLFLAGALFVGHKLFERVPPWSDARLTYRVSAFAVALLLFAILSLLYDFARAARRKDPAARARRSFRFARRVLSGSWSWPRAFGVAVFWLIAGGAVVLALFGLEWSGNATSWTGIALHTGLQAAVIVARSAVRVAAWGSELALFDERAWVTA